MISSRIAGHVVFRRRNVAGHGCVRQKDLLFIQPRVAAVLVLIRHHADDAVRERVDGDLSAGNVGTRAEKLLLDLDPDDADAFAGLFFPVA